MPVVINEFEVVVDPQAQHAEGTAAAPQPSGDEELDPKDVMPILRALEVKALRAWAH